MRVMAVIYELMLFSFPLVLLGIIFVEGKRMLVDKIFKQGLVKRYSSKFKKKTAGRNNVVVDVGMYVDMHVGRFKDEKTTHQLAKTKVDDLFNLKEISRQIVGG